jgi:hypothetical protein
MKSVLLTCLLALPLSAWAQGTLEVPATTEAGPNHRVLTWTTTERDQAGNALTVPHQVTELADSLNWLNPLTGRYEPTVEVLEITAQGYAVARRGPLKVIVAPDLLATPATDLELPGPAGLPGQRLQLSPRFLTFHERTTGKSVLLGQVKSSVAELVASNVIVFPDAFDGAVKGSIRYSYRRASWEQDLILEQQIAGSPQDWGLDPAHTIVELYTESLGPDTPRRVRQAQTDGGPADSGPADGSITDERLEFAGASISEGVAYAMGREAESVPVCETWAEAAGHRFIVESVPWLRLQGLMERAGLAKTAAGSRTSLGPRPMSA